MTHHVQRLAALQYRSPERSPTWHLPAFGVTEPLEPLSTRYEGSLREGLRYKPRCVCSLSLAEMSAGS